MSNKFKFYPHKMHWYEGMPLSPHHFQQSDEINHNIYSYLFQQILPYHWGIVKLELDTSNIKDGIIQIKHLEAILENRELLFLPTNNKSIDINLKEALSKENKNEMKVFIAIPKSKYTYESDSHNQGYEITQKNDVEDYNTGNSSTCIFNLEPKYKIFFDKVPFNFTGIQICTIYNGPAGIELGKYDPPCLTTTNAQNIINRIKKNIQILKNKTIYVKKQININSNAINTNTINSIITQGILPVEYLLNLSHVHPNQLFEALVNMIAHISVFDSELAFHSIPEYNHKNLLESFEPIFKITKQIIETIKDPYILHTFTEQDQVFKFKIENYNNEIFLLLSYNNSVDMDEARKWANSCIIANKSNIDDAIEKRILGAAREVEPVESKNLRQFIIKIQPDDKFVDANEELYICNPSANTKPDSIAFIEFIEQ